MPLLTSAVLTAGLKMAAPALISTAVPAVMGAVTGGGGGGGPSPQHMEGGGYGGHGGQGRPSPQQMAGLNAMHNMGGGGGGPAGPAGLLGGIATQMLPGLIGGLMGGKRR